MPWICKCGEKVARGFNGEIRAIIEATARSSEYDFQTASSGGWAVTKLATVVMVLEASAQPLRLRSRRTIRSAPNTTSTKPITLTGVLTKIEWTNPHTHLYLDVKDEQGKVVNWQLEGYPPVALSQDRLETRRHDEGRRHAHGLGLARA